MLALFGWGEAKHVEVKQFKVDRQVSMGQQLDFEFELISKNKELGQLRVEFILDFMKSNGKTAGKIFKISEGQYSQSSRNISKYFSFKPISTRKYYPGEHFISIVVNGKVMAKKRFELISG